VAIEGDKTMMRAILGSAAGGAVAGAIALAASAQAPRATEPAWQATGQPASAYAMPVANAPALRSALTNAPTLVDCEPGQRAVLQQTVVDGREIARVACVTEQVAAPVVYGTPVSYYESRPFSPQPDIVQRPAVQQVVTRPRATRVASTRREVEPTRSWKKTALIIGGSTGAGAGVGAIAGGKKGALIGAAIGGGAASIYEAMKRK
jgi:hypothetical protein